VLILKGIPDSKYGTFLSAKMNIAAEDLENAEPFQRSKFIPKEAGGKSQRRKDIVVHPLPVR
jgi:hypothetical protein